jgi:hypothetical protein
MYVCMYVCRLWENSYTSSEWMNEKYGHNMNYYFEFLILYLIQPQQQHDGRKEWNSLSLFGLGVVTSPVMGTVLRVGTDGAIFGTVPHQ